MEQLDQSVVRLAKAIRRVESNDNFEAKGASGEYGAYQYMPSTARQWSKQYLGYETERPNKQEQNKIAYYKIKELKDKGYKPDQIAGIWNSGTPNYQDKVGVNKYGVSYNTPAYVAKVKNAYMQIGDTQIQQKQEAQQQEQPVEAKEKKKSFLGGVAQSIGKSVLSPLVRTGQLIKKGIAGMSGDTELQERVDKDIYEGRKYFGVNIPGVKGFGEGGVKQAVGEGLDFASNIPLAGTSAIATQGVKLGGKQVLKSIATPLIKEAALSGAMAGAGSALQDNTNVGTLVKRTLGGAVIGGATSKLGSMTADKLLTKTVGGQPKVVNEVVDKLKQYSGQGKNVKKVIAKFEKSDAYNTLVKNYIKGVTVADNKIVADIGIKNILSDISSINDEVAKRIKADPSIFSEVSVISKLRNAIDGSGLVGTSKLKAKEYFTKETQNILKDYGVSGGKLSAESVYSLRKHFDDIASKTFKINNGVVTPKEQAARAMADELRDILRSNIKDKSVGDMLKAESKLLSTKDLMETLNGRVVKGGRLGRYFAGAVGAGIGAVSGAPLGGAGAVIGGYVGKEAAEKLQRIVANGAVGTIIQRYKLNKISKNAISELLDAGKLDEAVAEALMKTAPAVKTKYDNAVIRVVTSPTFKKITTNAIIRQSENKK